MCNFLSAIVHKNGRILCDPEHTDSHSDLIAANNLRGDDDIHIRGWIRVEFMPPNGELDHPDKYELKVDETSTPDWFDDAMRFDVTEKLRDNITAMIVDNDRECLLGGCWMLVGKGNVNKVRHGRIVYMTGASCAAVLESSQVGEMRGSSRVGTMWGLSRVGAMWDSSQVGEMRESSQVGEMWGLSQVGTMWGLSRVGAMWDSSQVGEMRESSQVGEMWGLSRVGVMWGLSRVGAMWESSKSPNNPINDKRTPTR